MFCSLAKRISLTLSRALSCFSEVSLVLWSSTSLVLSSSELDLPNQNKSRLVVSLTHLDSKARRCILLTTTKQFEAMYFFCIGKRSVSETKRYFSFFDRILRIRDQMRNPSFFIGPNTMDTSVQTDWYIIFGRLPMDTLLTNAKWWKSRFVSYFLFQSRFTHRRPKRNEI